jgi:hypothetical protein
VPGLLRTNVFAPLKYLFLFSFWLNNVYETTAQTIVHSKEDEIAFYAQTKQINQFFKRFNNEESIDGKKYDEKDSLYRDSKTRKKFLQILFDNENTSLTNELKKNFIKDVTDPSHPLYLKFHNADWFAQVATIFYWQGKEEKVTLFLKLQEEKVGSKWVITKILFEPLGGFLKKDSTDTTHFLHPMSHELEFINLYKVFQDNKDLVQDYTEKGYTADYLSLFLYEVKKGNLKFKTVYNVKFHFFQIDQWYFEVSNFNRTGRNTGWLISNLRKVNKEERESLLERIYEQYD